MHQFLKFILFWNITLHVSDGLSVHHQDFKTVHTATGRSRDRIPVGARFSAPVQTGPGAHPASCTMGTGSFPRLKSGRGVTLAPHPLLAPWSWKGTATPLLPLWAVRLVQSLSACKRGALYLTYSNRYMSNRYCCLHGSKQATVSVW